MARKVIAIAGDSFSTIQFTGAGAGRCSLIAEIILAVAGIVAAAAEIIAAMAENTRAMAGTTVPKLSAL